jgi:hypothetical protein
MSDSATWHWSIRRQVGALIAALVGYLGCSALDTRARGNAAQVQGAAPPRVNSSASTPLAVADVPAMETTRTLASVASPTSGEPESSPTQLRSGAQPSASSPDLTGIQRSYLSSLGNIGSEPRAMATRYASLYPAACRAELRRRSVAVVPAQGFAVGIAVPMRLTGSLHNVRFVTPGPKSVHGMLDCRLVLLLDELAGLLAEQGVAVVYVDGFYRPRAHLPGKKSPSQHAFGLAVDIHAFGTKDGRTLVIERDFAGRIGAPVCGAEAVLQPESRDAIELRNIVCSMARAKAFHYLLTPNHDESHSNHVHGDIKRGGREHVLR